MAEVDFLGKGIKFPFTIQQTGSGVVKKANIAVSSDAELVRESIRIILSTNKGERVMRPDFGADLAKLAFAPNSTATATMLSYTIREALELWEPRIEVKKVSAVPDGTERNKLDIQIEYKLLTSNSQENLVFPFYLEGAPLMESSIYTPRIDERSMEDVVQRLRKLIEERTEKQFSVEDLKQDPQANALIHVYSNMIQGLLERLNRVPEKNYLAFLNMLGVRPEPPKAARTPVRFTLDKDSTSKYVLVPKYTIVSGAEPDSGEEFVFETEEEFTIIHPSLKQVVGINGTKDRWSNLGEMIFDPLVEDSRTIFEGVDLIPHRLYIGDEKSLSFSGDTDIIVKVDLEILAKEYRFNGDIRWYYYSEEIESVVELEVVAAAERESELSQVLGADPDIAAFLKSGYIQLENAVDPVGEKELSGFWKADYAASISGCSRFRFVGCRQNKLEKSLALGGT